MSWIWLLDIGNSLFRRNCLLCGDTVYWRGILSLFLRSLPLPSSGQKSKLRRQFLPKYLVNFYRLKNNNFHVTEDKNLHTHTSENIKCEHYLFYYASTAIGRSLGSWIRTLTLSSPMVIICTACTIINKLCIFTVYLYRVCDSQGNNECLP